MAIDMAMWRRWLLFCVDKDKTKYSYFLNGDRGIAVVTGKYPRRYTSGFVWIVPRRAGHRKYEYNPSGHCHGVPTGTFLVYGFYLHEGHEDGEDRI